ncbi:MAG: hypothetical protein A2Z31_04790 [candidate division NC10 bacterium RBG_16_65_8]|nr:MAG: hypothetical protein A2Z31_04790 [candidate division NC10 bacterium RBG_16_65_8]
MGKMEELSMSVYRTLVGILVAAIAIMAGAGALLAGEAPSAAKQSVAGGGVTVVVTRLEDAAGGPAFHVVLDTHSANLDGYRFEEIVQLRDGKGGEVAPAAVEGAKGSGHHREATVRFAWPDPRPANLQVAVKGVAGVSEREFRWPLQ